MSASIQEAAPQRCAAAAAPPPAVRRQRLVALAAAVAAVASRVPFAARRLWDHDSVQFALGVERYDLAAHHPHPPGYPLYVAILKLLAAAGIDALHGMVALSIAAAALGAALIVPLTARLASAAAAAGASAANAAPTPGGPGPRAAPPESAGPLAAGALAAALYVCNPLLWFYGELPLVYAVEGGLTVGLAYAALRMADGRGPLLAACAAFALAGGVRPSTLVLLLPLFLLGAWRARRRGATIGTLTAGAAVAAVCGLAWLLPLLAAAGGLGAYRRIGSENFGALLPYTSILYGAGWPALAHNLTIMTKWFLQGLVPAAVALGGLWLWPDRRRGRLAQVAASVRMLAASWTWLAAWAVPPMLFFALFHVTKAGYTLVYLPALLVAASLLAAPSWLADGAAASGRADGAAASGRGDGARLGVALALAAATGAGFFLLGADRRPDQPRLLAVVRNEFNRGAIAAYERDLDRLLALLRRLPPAATVLATVELSGTGPAGADGFLYPWQRHLQWYLPGYEVLHLVPEERLAFATRGHRPFQREGPAIELPAGTRQLAIVLSGSTGERFPLAAWPPQPIGKTFDLVVVPVSEHLELGPFRFTIRRRQAA